MAPGKPVQLVLPSGITSIVFHFRVPDMNNNNIWNDQTLTGSLGNLTPIINWSLSASGETLQASGTQIKASEIL